MTARSGAKTRPRLSGNDLTRTEKERARQQIGRFSKAGKELTIEKGAQSGREESEVTLLRK
ncbi:hypothetical protein SAMCCGM7_pC0907 (plasmid) [Sinorhizobium americanum CCGM7]|nr:hypothetical protein SAMCCGM7_pC0907 [Sinorhizobium americanum CCGM7]